MRTPEKDSLTWYYDYGKSGWRGTEFLPNPQRASAKVRMWLGLESRAALPEGCANTHFQGCT